MNGCQPVLRVCIEDVKSKPGRLCPHHRQERLNTDDVHYAREIIGEHVQCHLGGDLRQALHQKVRGAHPHLQRRERMLGCLAPLAHRLRVLIETLLHGFEHVLVLPSLNAPLRSFVHCDLSGHCGHAVVQ
jgi:hypothetical protein